MSINKSQKSIISFVFCILALIIILLNKMNNPILLSLPGHEYVVPALIFSFAVISLFIATKIKIEKVERSTIISITHAISIFIVAMYMLFFIIFIIKQIF